MRKTYLTKGFAHDVNVNNGNLNYCFVAAIDEWVRGRLITYGPRRSEFESRLDIMVFFPAF